MSDSVSWILIQVPKKHIEEELRINKKRPKIHANNDGGDQQNTNNKEEFVKYLAMEESVKPTLKNMGINPIFQQHSEDDNQILFSCCAQSNQVEHIIIELNKLGIGQSSLTSVSVMPATINYGPLQTTKSLTNDDRANSFYSTIKSRLLVAEVVSRIEAGSKFSFDFLLLLILAGMIAFMGLLENSSVVLVASMLVSPLMGPILAGIFGAVIRDSELILKGIYHEVVALLICIALGFFLGLVVCPFYGTQFEDWPTNEMISRGNVRALWVGILIAIPSGAGVALSVLGGNAGSLVGVAISASLLPPAVNAGLFWANSVHLMIGIPGASFHIEHLAHHKNKTIYDTLGENVTSIYTPLYHDNLVLECFSLGLVSLTVTLVNIICIIFMGVLVLKIKEVTPEKIPIKFSSFWKKDVPAHINYYKTLRRNNKDVTDGLQARLVEKIPRKRDSGLEGTFLQSMFEKAASDEQFINIKQWVANPISILPPRSFDHQMSTNQLSPESYNFNRQTSETERALRMDTYLDVENFVRQEISNYMQNDSHLHQV